MAFSTSRVIDLRVYDLVEDCRGSNPLLNCVGDHDFIP